MRFLGHGLLPRGNTPVAAAMCSPPPRFGGGCAHTPPHKHDRPSSATDLSSKLALFRAFRYNIPRRRARQSRTAHPIQGGAMGLYIDRGNSGFKSALSGTIQYVDKSGLIAHLNANIDSGQRFLCITRPRRFGKTLAAQMIAAYYNRPCNSRDLFANLDIARDPSYETHLNRYPVIFFDVQEQRSNVTRGDDFVAYLQEKIGFELKTMAKRNTKLPHYSRNVGANP